MTNVNPALISNNKSVTELITEILNGTLHHMRAANRLYDACSEGLVTQKTVEETYNDIWAMLTDIGNPTCVIKLFNSVCDKNFYITSYYDVAVIEEGLHKIFMDDSESLSAIHEFFKRFTSLFKTL